LEQSNILAAWFIVSQFRSTAMTFSFEEVDTLIHVFDEYGRSLRSQARKTALDLAAGKPILDRKGNDVSCHGASLVSCLVETAQLARREADQLIKLQCQFFSGGWGRSPKRSVEIQLSDQARTELAIAVRLGVQSDLPASLIDKLDLS
jgi:hypothetical protein